MKTSNDRILTTHVGSLPRPDDLVELLWAQDRDENFDPDELEHTVTEAVREVVRIQANVGIDFISEGEMRKPNYTFCVRHRLTGIADASQVVGGVPVRPIHGDVIDFPELMKARAEQRAVPVTLPRCIAWETSLTRI